MENESTKYIFACNLSELSEGSGKKVVIEDEEIALFREDGQIYALNNFCLHQHKSIIHDGFIEDGFVVCPAHGWKFKLENGKQPGERRGLKSYEVKVEENKVYIKVTKDTFKW